MDRFTLSIELGNDAMQSPADVGRALDKVATGLVTATWDGVEFGTVRDENGNAVGRWYATPETTWWTNVDPLVAPCSVCGATAYTVENNEPRCPEHLEPLGKP